MNMIKNAMHGLKAKGIEETAMVCSRSIREINKHARLSDSPSLYPYRSVADKAIRWYSRVYFPSNGPVSNFEYAAGLESRMSQFINE